MTRTCTTLRTYLPLRTYLLTNAGNVQQRTSRVGVKSSRGPRDAFCRRHSPKQRRRRLRTRAQDERVKTVGGLFKDQLYKRKDGRICAISRLKAYQRNPALRAKTRDLKKAYAEAPNRGFIPAQRSQTGHTTTVTVCPPTSAPSQTAQTWTSWFSEWRGSTPNVK